MKSMIARASTPWPAVAFALCVATAGAGCGDDDDNSCNLAEGTGCSDGQVCEAVEGSDPACFDPVTIRGQIFDLGDDSGIGGARIVAIDVNGAARSPVAISGSDGGYDLRIPSTRDDSGAPEALELTLRVDAAEYQSFPGGLRQALPIDTGSAESTDDGYVVQSALTDVGLFVLEADAGTLSVAGTVEVSDVATGILVVAENDDSGLGFSAIADQSGDYQIFNLPSGSYTVIAYAKGVNYQSTTVELTTDASDVDLAIADQTTGTVDGSISIVNAPGGAVTSIILALESTFDDTLGRGPTIPGLRDPAPGAAADVSSAYSIEGVPAGRYVVLAAFENDALVRDPDTSIAGTSILHIEVVGGQTTTVEGFKVTEALEILGPGAQGVEEVSGTPTFSWVDDSSEDMYLIELFDALGELVWSTEIAGVSGEDPAVPYDGDALEPGMYYQFRVTSSRDSQAGQVPISRTEDLLGVFKMTAP